MNQRLDQADLETMGILALVIGVVWMLGSMGCRVGGLVARWRAIRDRVGPVGGAVSGRWPP